MSPAMLSYLLLTGWSPELDAAERRRRLGRKRIRTLRAINRIVRPANRYSNRL